jgi:hypothetical protein
MLSGRHEISFACIDAGSKTMCGYGTEEKNFALELTYNVSCVL